MEKIVHWKLKPGTQQGQETAEQKRNFGYDYIERLAQEENIVNVVDEGDKLVIYIEDGQNS